ncbi:MAG: hypothetical protein LUI87_18250, partial [Lachnospiraceae bacterium]|nr:hypothetical protein [Lachnospiraceae bacterium]
VLTESEASETAGTETAGTETAGTGYIIEEPNQGRYFLIDILNETEVIAETDVKVDFVTDEGERTEAISYTGAGFYLFEVEDGFYEVTVSSEGYEPVITLCRVDEDTCIYVMYLKLEAAE